jgi:bacterioferritin
MANAQQTQPEVSTEREQLIKDLNEDLAREYQAIIAYVIYSQVLKGAEFMGIADELEKHAAEELKHALIISKQIDYLGGMPGGQPKPVHRDVARRLA